MKNSVFILLSLLALVSCKKNNDHVIKIINESDFVIEVSYADQTTTSRFELLPKESIEHLNRKTDNENCSEYYEQHVFNVKSGEIFLKDWKNPSSWLNYNNNVGSKDEKNICEFRITNDDVQ